MKDLTEKDLVELGHKCGKPTMRYVVNQARERRVYRTKYGDVDSGVLFHILSEFMYTALSQMEYSRQWEEMCYAAVEIAIRLPEMLERMEGNEL